MTAITLASRSPRRRDLLVSVGFRVVPRPADVDETQRSGETPVDLALRLARLKAEAVIASDDDAADRPDTLIAADTVVHTDDGRVLGKPAGRDDAARILRALSGTTHSVTTGWCLGSCAGGVLSVHATTTRVSFVDLNDDLVDAYLATDEPWDKAGAYGIQGLAAVFVSGIDGCWSNVVGLPVSAVVAELGRLGRIGAAPWGAA